MGISLLLSILKGKSNQGKGDKKRPSFQKCPTYLTKIHLTVTQQIHNNEIPNMLLTETAMCVFHFGTLWISLRGADKPNDTLRIKRKKLNKQVASSPGAHLTSTSPPTCITNEPSGCFTDHRKSNSFSLEKQTCMWWEEEQESRGYGLGEGDKERERTGEGNGSNLIKH